jgi:hypothetical protein
MQKLQVDVTVNCAVNKCLFFQSSWSICTHCSRFWAIMGVKSSDNFKSKAELGVPTLCLHGGFLIGWYCSQFSNYQHSHWTWVNDRHCTRCATLNCAFRWTQQLDGLYLLQYFFSSWHCQHALVSTMLITSHAIRVQHV